MLANHDRFTHQMCDRLKTTGMGLALVRLLQDAGRIEEARTTLSSLEDGFQDVAVESVEPSRKPCKANRLKGVTTTASCSSGSASTKIAASEMRPEHWSIA
jgi:hypothetical protein